MPQKFKNLKVHEAARLRRKKRQHNKIVRSKRIRMPKIYKPPVTKYNSPKPGVKAKKPWHKKVLAKVFKK